MKVVQNNLQEEKRRGYRAPECGGCYARIFTEDLDQQFFIAANFAPDLRKLAKGLIVEQQRQGKNGIPFGILKFTTMRDDLATSTFASFEVIPTENPRITKKGKFLRRYWLDELPQVINLARGHVKLIGPRALPRATAEVLPSKFVKRRSTFKPGCISIAYADPYKSVSEMIRNERLYMYRYERAPIRTDAVYLMKFLYNVAFRKVRGQ